MDIIFIIFLASLVYYLFMLMNFLFGYKNLPPGPNMLSNILNISQLVNKPHIALTNLSKIYGPLISLRVGTQLFVVASSPDLAKKIHKTHNPMFTGRYLPSLLYDVPGTTDASVVMSRECNEKWKFLRGITQNSFFSAKAIKSSSGLRKSKIMEMMRFLSVEKIGQVVNVEEMIFAVFINVMSNGLVSRDLFKTGGVGEKDAKVRVFVAQIIDKCAPFGLPDVFPELRWFDFVGRRRAMKIYQGEELIWGDTINERRRMRDVDPNREQDFLDIVLGTTMTDDQILALLTEILTGGADSSTITSVWLITEMIKNQEILRKVRQEIQDIAVEGNTLNESLLSNCRYFQACIKESLRLHVPGPLGLPRRAIETCKVDNYVIPKDTVVLMNTWAIQMDPKNWEDPYSFKPERFIDSEIDFLGNHFEYIPFSSGPRMCPGRNLGITSVEMVVAYLVHYFEWSLPNGEESSKIDTSDRFSTSLKKAKPLYLIPKLRNEMWNGTA